MFTRLGIYIQFINQRFVMTLNIYVKKREREREKNLMGHEILIIIMLWKQ